MRLTTAGVLVAAVTLGPAGAALADPGDAQATGVTVELDATVIGEPVLAASATIGSATAPPTDGTDSSTLVDIDLPGAIGVSADGTVDEVTAIRAPGVSSAFALISGLGLEVLGVEVLTASTITAEVVCPAVGPQIAAASLTDLELFGAAVTLEANAPPVEATVGVTVPGVTGASLGVSLTRTETVSADEAAAVAVDAALSLTGTVLGVPIAIDVGTVTIAQASCERALAAAPTVDAIAPDEGPATGGTTVTIVGEDLDDVTEVTFGGVAGMDLVVDPSGESLTVITPPGAPGAVDVVVTTPGGSATVPDGFTYLAAPAIDTIDPDEGPATGGTAVTIEGDDLDGATEVSFGGVPGTDLVVDPSGTSLTVVTPPGAPGTVDVVVTTPGGTTAAPDGFTYLAVGVPPSVATIDPDEGPATGGTVVTIEGDDLDGATEVTFGGVPGTDLVVDPSGESLTVVTPPGAPGAVDVVVTTPGGSATVPDGFTYLTPAPEVASIDPDEGPATGGTTVTIEGDWLDGATDVTFDGAAGTDLVVDPSGTSLTVVTPAGAPGAVDVVVTTPAGATTVTGGFTYLAVGTPPVVDAIGPDEGPATGGTTVTIEGADLDGALEVTFGGVAGTDLVVDPSGTSLTVVTPAGAPGLVDVVVTTTGGEVTVADGFAYVLAEVIEDDDADDGTGDTGDDAAEVTPAPLPRTGAGAGQALTFGLLLLAAGGLLLRETRRRILPVS